MPQVRVRPLDANLGQSEPRVPIDNQWLSESRHRRIQLCALCGPSLRPLRFKIFAAVFPNRERSKKSGPSDFGLQDPTFASS